MNDGKRGRVVDGDDCSVDGSASVDMYAAVELVEVANATL